MRRNRRPRTWYWLIGAGVLFVVATSVAVSKGEGIGGIDPLSASVAVLSLLATLWLAFRQPINLADETANLAARVLNDESTEYAQLLSNNFKPINVKFVLRHAPPNPTGLPPEGTFQEVTDYYCQLRSRRMVITGAPGAGKTVLATNLILHLLAERSPGDRVPIRLPAASWEPGQHLEELLRTHLKQNFRLSSAVASALVRAHLLLPVLDGLDEMDMDPTPGFSSRAGQALRDLDAYSRGHDRIDVVLTCRSSQYETLQKESAGGKDLTWVEIQPVEPEKALTFLEERITGLSHQNGMARWASVLDAIDFAPTGPLAQGLSTPWRLTLATTVYERRDSHGLYPNDPAELIDPGLDTEEKIRDHLLSSYVSVLVERGQSHQVNDSERQVRIWLTTLAKYLENNSKESPKLGGRTLSGINIVLHELWPMGGNRLPRAINAILIIGIFGAGFITARSYGVVGAVVAEFFRGPAASLPAAYVYLRVWPGPHTFTLRTALFSLACGSAMGIVFGAIYGIYAGITSTILTTVLFWIGFGSFSGLSFGNQAIIPTNSREPRSVVRDDFVFGGLVAAVVGTIIGLTFGITVGAKEGTTSGLALGITAGLTMGMVSGLVSGARGVRYIVFLTCSRKWSKKPLPWRLGRFMHRCYELGLIRRAGIAYQFRHQELQDYLAKH